MTTFTDREVIVTEGALAVMATTTALSAAAGVMIQRLRRGDLASLRHAGTNLVTVIAIGFWIMLRVAESNSEGRHVLRRARVAAQLMAGAAR